MRVSVIGLGAVVAVAGFLAVSEVLATGEAEEVERRTVVIYDGGQKRVVKTDARTVGELLERIDTSLAIGDKVAPEEDVAIDSNTYYVNIFRATPYRILEWADARTARLYGEGDGPISPHLYDVVQGEEEEASAGQSPDMTKRPPTINLTPLKIQWMSAAGIPEADWAYVDHIVFRESSWNPNAVNRSSGACGLAQAFPCSKVPGNPFDPVDSLKWQYGYVKARYGGYAGAYAFWQRNRWY
ncbi:ubiquitin-like domain-containing protein [Candidatus Saccharibacteria bacterium]|nr:ubiquitin-like domain-containing protein [Candidatus Saccharibacteria bacterium]